MDAVPFKVDICSCQAIQLTHTQAGSHKNDDIIIIVSAIVLNELQIFLLLFSGQCYCMNAVVSNDLPAAEHFGEQTFLAALGIAGGMAIAWCLADLSRKLRGRL